MQTQPNRSINILHLSDLHFGMDNSAENTIVLDKLIDSIDSLDADWKPDLVVVSGDIGWHGDKPNYKKAEDWLKRLLGKLKLTAKELVVCPGEEDLDLDTANGLGIPSSVKEADDWLNVNKIKNNLSNPFANYMAFCKKINMPANKLGKSETSYLVGCRDIKGLNFIVLNSAWFYRNGHPDKLWLGRPHIVEMEAEKQLNEYTINIAIFHHSESDLDIRDQYTYQGRKGAYPYIAENCYLILTGHTHASPSEPKHMMSAWNIQGGAVYQGAGYQNYCSIIKIDKDREVIQRNVIVYSGGNGSWSSKVWDNEYGLVTGSTNSVKLDGKNSSPQKVLTVGGMPEGAELIGREVELAELKELVEADNANILVHGMGGVGKTELCKSYFRESYKCYKHFAWINYRSSIKESFVSQFNIPGITNRIYKEIDRMFEAIVGYLQALGKECLLVIDNMDNQDDEDLSRIVELPLKLVITSRMKYKGLVSQKIGPLAREQCLKLFYSNYKGEKDDEYLTEIVELAGKHTLTVEMLAKTANDSAIELKDFYRELKMGGFNLKQIREALGSIEKHNDTNYRFSHLLKLSGITDAEKYILSNLSILPATYIELRAIWQWLALENKYDLNSLINKGWLDRKGSTVYMSLDIGKIIRYQTKPNLENCRQLVESISSALDYESGDDPLTRAKYVLYAESICSYLDEETSEMATLYNNLTRIYRVLGQFDDALKYQLKAVAIREKHLSSEHPDLADSYDNISGIYRELDQLDNALEYQLKAVFIREVVLHSKHPELADSYNNLSLIYNSMKQFEDALKYQLKAVAIRKKIFSSEHPDLGNSYHNLALIYLNKKQFEDALEFQLKALTIWEKALSPEHPDLATSYNNLSGIYMGQGRLEEALKYQLKAVAIMEAVLDSSHPDLATSYHNLAGNYFDMEEYKKAVFYEEKAIAIWETNFPKDHKYIKKGKDKLEKYKRAADK